MLKTWVINLDRNTDRLASLRIPVMVRRPDPDMRPGTPPEAGLEVGQLTLQLDLAPQPWDYCDLPFAHEWFRYFAKTPFFAPRGRKALYPIRPPVSSRVRVRKVLRRSPTRSGSISTSASCADV